MAQLTGVLAADFSSFETAVDDAVVKLKGLDSGAAQVGTSLSRMVDQFSGRKLIQDAAVMVEAIERVGGASQLTAADLAKAGKTADEAIAKMSALGLQVPERLQAVATAARGAQQPIETLGTSTVKTTNSVGDFSKGLGTADRTLAAFGVNVGPQIRALDELSAMLGKNVSQLGLWGTASAIAAAGVAGWQLGKQIDEWTGLSTAIGDAAANLMNWGDVAAQRAGAGMDVLNRASDLAGRVISDFAEAQRIIVASNQATAESFNTGAVRIQRWNKELADGAQHLPTIEAELKNHSSTVQQLSTHYKISAEAITYHMRTLTESAAKQKAWADEARPRYEALKNAQLELNNAGDGWRQTLATIPPAVAAVVTEYLSMGASQTALATKFELSKFQVQALNNAWKEQLATMARTEPALGTLAGWMQTIDPAIRKAGESQMFFDQQLIASLGTIEQTIPALEKMEGQIRSVTLAEQEAAAVSKNAPGSVGVTLGGGGGIRLNTDLQSAVGQYNQRYGLGGSSQPDFLAWALASGLATKTAPTVNNTFNIVDTESGIARRVSDEVGRTIQRGSLVT